MLTVELINHDELLARFDRMPDNVRTELVRTVTALAIQLETYVKANKLSGQVLNVRTGALRSSIFHEVEAEGSSVIGIVGAPASVPYAAIHEFGGTINVPDIYPKTAKALHFFMGGKEVFAKHVRAHTIHMPERSYLRSALADMQNIITTQLKAAVVRGTQRR